MALVKKCLWGKIISLYILGFISAVLFILSLRVDYQWLLAEEHVRFRSGFPSQANWITSPYGTLSCYLFNVTNSKEFLNGQDSKLKLKQVGPIVYRVKGRNQVLNQTDNSLTFRKIRYNNVEFDAEASYAPDILNQTIIMPNLLLLGAAAKFHGMGPVPRFLFNTATLTEPVFLNDSVYYFLWNFTTPELKFISNYIPNIVSNCGMLYNALKNKEEIYNVKIGLNEGVDNFFHAKTLNGKMHFPEHNDRAYNSNYKDMYCPIKVPDAFDNSIFPPFLKSDDPLTIIAAESCRTFELKYNGTVSHLGFSGNEYVVTYDRSTNHCLNKSMGIDLHTKMFDATKCLFNDVPAAFSSPHFYGSSYNWSEHFEGLSPNLTLHEASIIIEPITGIPIEEKYRFQSNIPMPDFTPELVSDFMSGYRRDLNKFSSMVIPTFWYEYDLDDLPGIVLFLMRLNIFGVPILQPIFVIVFSLLAIFSFFKLFFLIKYVFEKMTRKSLETNFTDEDVKEDDEKNKNFN